VEKDGWVYLANPQSGMRVLDLDPVYLEHYRIDDEIKGYPAGIWYDFYPALAVDHGKQIILQGLDTNNKPFRPEDGVKVRFVPLMLPDGTSTLPAGIEVTSKAGDKDATPFEGADALASFYVKVDPAKFKWDEDWTKKKIPLTFEIDLTTLGKTEHASQNQSGNDPKNYRKTINLIVRTNANVTFSQVLNGEAAYVFNDKLSDFGKTVWAVNSDNTPPEQVKFDFVQEIFNQVVPRKRALTNADDSKAEIELLAENGVFNAKVSERLKLFKRNFKLNINTKAGFYQPGSMPYSTDLNQDNTSPIFRKLMKDYGYQQVSANGSWLKKPDMLDQVVDQNILLGKERKLYGVAAIPDQEIGKDAGLYELYVNVVKRVVDKMIETAELYSGRRGTKGVDAPTDKWVSRTGEGSGSAESGGHGSGMAYSFSGRKTISEFNDKVVENCNVGKITTTRKEYKIIGTNPDKDAIPVSKCTGCHATLSNLKSPSDPSAEMYLKYAEIPDETAVGSDYEGNVSEIGCKLDGNKQYSGLYENEHSLKGKIFQYVTVKSGQVTQSIGPFPQFNGDYWSGIDCSGFVAASVESGTKLSLPGTKIIFPSFTSATVELITKNNAANARYLFDVQFIEREKRTNNDANTNEHKLMKRGDIVLYGGHASIFYSNRWGQSKVTKTRYWDEEEQALQRNRASYFELIHAFGDNYYGISQNNDEPIKIFSRKVMVTGSNIGSYDNSFGRLMIWE